MLHRGDYNPPLRGDYSPRSVPPPVPLSQRPEPSPIGGILYLLVGSSALYLAPSLLPEPIVVVDLSSFVDVVVCPYYCSVGVL